MSLQSTTDITPSWLPLLLYLIPVAAGLLIVAAALRRRRRKGGGEGER